MSIYVLAERNESELSSPIFRAGPDETEESAAVFTTQDQAESYIRQAGWTTTETVAELNPESLLHWVLNLRSDGVQYLAVNPNRREQEASRQQAVLSIVDVVAEMTENLSRQLNAPAQAPLAEMLRINIYHCQDCGRVFRRHPNKATPMCCQQKTEFAAPDTVPA